MAEYIERQALLNALKEEQKKGNFVFTSKWIKEIMDSLPTADVAPKSEVDEVNAEWAEAYKKLEYTLVGVMHSVDKWLEGEELEQDEVGRAIAMRKKTLQIVKNAENKVEFLRKTIAENAQQALEVTLEEIEKAKTEVAREIFEEMDELLSPYGTYIKTIDIEEYAELKKKYTESENG